MGGLSLVMLVVWGFVWIWALIDIARWPDEKWAATGQSRLLWLAAVFFFQFFGLIAYLGSARPRLQAQT
jgi:hypothetical protein